MNKIESDIKRIFGSESYIDNFRLIPYSDVHKILANYFREKNEKRPLIFLSKHLFERFKYATTEYYQPDMSVDLEKENNYYWIRVVLEYPRATNVVVYVLKKETDNLYTIRGYVSHNHFCFAPKDIDIESFKVFIHDTCAHQYSQNVSFDYPVYIG